MALGVGLVVVRANGSSTASPAKAVPNVDPRLLLHPHWTPFAGNLARGLHLHGSLYPAIPGRNAMRVALSGGNRGNKRPARIVLTMTMPGMKMTPVHAVVLRHGGLYTGRAVIPMFGVYVARVTVSSPIGIRTGAVIVNMPLPLIPSH